MNTSCIEKKKQNIDNLNSESNQTQTGELTHEQRSALDVLTWLQINTDKRNHLYSTFPNIEHPCYPADTTFEISQSQFLYVMQEFIEKHCTYLTAEVQDQKAQSSVLAQNKYTVLHCKEDEAYTINKKTPMTGTWVIPNILGRIDLILVW